ncbi:predicted protein [Streptomyces viridochromogenes DSM 40736]|uniref:Predicted protein n=1 Tax=Streptomyces viridochromogenes (strain DSM 40736 / JCM 4977 / BCRC 1201 / Tue 494) TaxID=591159 RepID=D9X356_STRVT|nr:predicted protein [Streptomyces viridochromogenes DSM 40736]
MDGNRLVTVCSPDHLTTASQQINGGVQLSHHTPLSVSLHTKWTRAREWESFVDDFGSRLP